MKINLTAKPDLSVITVTHRAALNIPSGLVLHTAPHQQLSDFINQRCSYNM